MPSRSALSCASSLHRAVGGGGGLLKNLIKEEIIKKSYSIYFTTKGLVYGVGALCPLRFALSGDSLHLHRFWMGKKSFTVGK